MNHPPARQMFRKVPAHSLVPHEALDMGIRRLGLGLILALGRRQLLELKLQLIEEALAALRA